MSDIKKLAEQIETEASRLESLNAHRRELSVSLRAVDSEIYASGQRLATARKNLDELLKGLGVT